MSCVKYYRTAVARGWLYHSLLCYKGEVGGGPSGDLPGQDGKVKSCMLWCAMRWLLQELYRHI